MYFTWPINIALDYNTAYNNFEYAWMRKKYFRIIRENGRIIAWIHADKMQPEFSKEIFMYQKYYCSNEKGFRAVKCLVLLHDDLLKETTRQNLTYALSCCRFSDTSFALSRILESVGWSRMGAQAVADAPRVLKAGPLWPRGDSARSR